MRRRTSGTGPEACSCGASARFPAGCCPSVVSKVHQGADHRRAGSPGPPARRPLGLSCSPGRVRSRVAILRLRGRPGRAPWSRVSQSSGAAVPMTSGGSENPDAVDASQAREFLNKARGYLAAGDLHRVGAGLGRGGAHGKAVAPARGWPHERHSRFHQVMNQIRAADAGLLARARIRRDPGCVVLQLGGPVCPRAQWRAGRGGHRQGVELRSRRRARPAGFLASG